jgi:hypothetical protein
MSSLLRAGLRVWLASAELVRQNLMPQLVSRVDFWWLSHLRWRSECVRSCAAPGSVFEIAAECGHEAFQGPRYELWG